MAFYTCYATWFCNSLPIDYIMFAFLHSFYPSSHCLDVLRYSVQGSLLFNKHIGNLCMKVNHCCFFVVADATKIFRYITFIYDCLDLQSDINRVKNWCTARHMILSGEKCFLFSRKTSTCLFLFIPVIALILLQTLIYFSILKYTFICILIVYFHLPYTC
jgi:hypothetical protein